MRNSRLLSVPLIALGLLVLGLVAATHFSPVTLPTGGSNVSFFEVELDGAVAPALIVGATFLVIGIAIEACSRKTK